MNNQEKVHVCYAIHDAKGGFCKFAGTSMCSLLANTEASVVLHLLHDETLAEGDYQRFLSLARKYGAEICFYPVQQLAGETLQYWQEHIKGLKESRFSPATLYRLLAGSLLPAQVKKLIYLDADTIVNLDIQELWKLPLTGYLMAAADEMTVTLGCPAEQPLVQAGFVPREEYFNAGVLVFDMQAFRQVPELATAGVDMLAKNPACFCYDQDILNYFFADSYRHLPLSFNDFVVSERNRGEVIVRRHIYHYAGKALDVFNPSEPFNELFLQYFVLTPWLDKAFMVNMFSHSGEAFEQRKRTLAKQLDLAAGRRRFFYGTAETMQEIQRIFVLKKDEECYSIVDSDGRLDAGRLMAQMRGSPGSLHVLCFALGDELKAVLEKAGFAEEQDFIDGRQYLPAAAGGWQLSGVDFFEQL